MSGEKRLRALLCATPEWQSGAAREAAAARLAAAGHALTAAALERRESNALRKADVFRLCRLWRYKSDVWQRAAPPAARAASADSSSPPLPLALLAPLVPMHSSRAQAVACHVATELGCHLRAFLAAAATPQLFAAGAAEPSSPCAVDAASCAARAACAARIAADLREDLATVRAAEALLSVRSGEHDGGTSDSGWLSAPPIAERVLNMQLLIASAHSAALADMTCPTNPAGISASNGGRALNCVERAHVEDAHEADAALRRFIAGASSFLARLRADGDARTYLAAAAGVVQLVMAVTCDVAAVEELRGVWAAGKQCSWRSPFWAHVAARQPPPVASALLGPST